MTSELVQVRELVAWGLDENSFRPHMDALPTIVQRARREVASRDVFALDKPILPDGPKAVLDSLDELLRRADLHAEMKGLDWTTGIVDLRNLLAFQRRLVFDAQFPHPEVPSLSDWPALFALAFGPPVPIAYRTLLASESELLLQSENPNLKLLTSIERSHIPFLLHGGSPFFEVAEFDGRWFLRDGYHRAYRLLRAGVAHFPAIIVRARTLAELGPVEPWFFPKATLFDTHPPRVIDFLDDNLTIEYARPRLLKTFRVTIEESVEPRRSICNPGESQ